MTKSLGTSDYLITRPFPASLSGAVSDLIPASCRSVRMDHGDETEAYPGRGMCCLTAHKSEIKAARRAIRIARTRAVTAHMRAATAYIK
jgi:hypothetical protein